MVVEQAERGAPEDVGVEPLLSVLVLEGLLPVDGGQVEDAGAGPAREQAEEIAEVAPGLDVVELAAREQGDEGCVDLAGVVAPDEQPVFSAHRFTPEGALGAVVVHGQTAVVEEALKGDTLVERVADGLGRGGLVQRAAGLLLAPGEEGLDDGPGLHPAGLESRLGRPRGPGALDAKQLADEGERLASALGIRVERLPPIP